MIEKNYKPLHAADVDKETVAGKPLEELYGGYLGNPEIAAYVARASEEPNIEERLKQLGESGEKIKILEVGAGTGIVGKSFAAHLYEKGLDIELTLSDRNIESFENTAEKDSNFSINKIVLDNKELTFKPKSFDFIVGRSFSHYEKDEADEIKVFQQVYEVLKPGGIFIDQATGFPTETEAELWRNIQRLIGKTTNLHTPEYTEQQLKQIFGEENISRAQDQPPLIHQTKQDFLKRFKLDERSEIINQIREMIGEIPETKRASFQVNDKDFSWDVKFTIFICRKDSEQ